jgi:hypothetical protein
LKASCPKCIQERGICDVQRPQNPHATSGADGNYPVHSRNSGGSHTTHPAPIADLLACGGNGHYEERHHRNGNHRLAPRQPGPGPCGKAIDKIWHRIARRDTLALSPLSFWSRTRRQPPRIIFKLFEGVFSISSDNLSKMRG